MSIAETVLWFVVVPLAVILTVFGLVLAFSGSRRAKRYRPGRPYDFKPVWFTAAPGGPSDGGPHELTSSAAHAEAATASTGTTGGASDRW